MHTFCLRGFSLLELVVVLTILVALGGIAVRVASPAKDDAHHQATRASLVTVRDAVLQYWSDTKLVPLDTTTAAQSESERFHVRWLFRNPIDDSMQMTPTYPDLRIGWNGPYIGSAPGEYTIHEDGNFTAAYGTTGDPAVLDAYPSINVPAFAAGHPIVIQDVAPTAAVRDVRIVSAGPNGVIETPLEEPTASLTDAHVGDDIYVAATLR